jgi:hypothetical protein
MKGTLTVWALYDTKKLESMEQLRKYFPNGEADDMNWCVLSTSGVHGSYTTLDDLEESWDITDDEDDNYREHFITVLVIQPRLVNLRYGDIEIAKEDIPYLRKLVSSSVRAIKYTQKENMEKCLK